MRSELSSRSRMIKEQKEKTESVEEEREKEREREKEKEIRRHAKTLKLWTRFSKEPYIRGNANNRGSRPYVEALACRSYGFFFINILFKIFHCVFDTTKLGFMHLQVFEDIWSYNNRCLKYNMR